MEAEIILAECIGIIDDIEVLTKILLACKFARQYMRKLRAKYIGKVEKEHIIDTDRNFFSLLEYIIINNKKIIHGSHNMVKFGKILNMSTNEYIHTKYYFNRKMSFTKRIWHSFYSEYECDNFPNFTFNFGCNIEFVFYCYNINNPIKNTFIVSKTIGDYSDRPIVLLKKKNIDCNIPFHYSFRNISGNIVHATFNFQNISGNIVHATFNFQNEIDIEK